MTRAERLAKEYAEREVPAVDLGDASYAFYREVVARHFLAGFEAAVKELREYSPSENPLDLSEYNEMHGVLANWLERQAEEEK